MGWQQMIDWRIKHMSQDKKLQQIAIESSNAEETKTNTICSIDINIQDDFKTFTEVEKFLIDYLTCPLCSDEMLFTHLTHFANHEVQESAHCEKCNIKIKENQHILH
jgi:hypothetical protein